MYFLFVILYILSNISAFMLFGHAFYKSVLAFFYEYEIYK
ncbi:hypothetical protein BMS3Abin07_00094 [bacterium BMS3Abin07]|nr:hypothetical protein BMS3Abin07_00094 [bacterium BMS3Abin07]